MIDFNQESKTDKFLPKCRKTIQKSTKM